MHTEPAAAEVLAGLGYPSGTSYVDLVRHMTETPPNAVAVVFGDESVTYGDLLRQIAGAAAFFEGLGLGRGDHIAIRLSNHPLTVVTYIAIELIGAVLIPVYREIEGEVLEGTLTRLDVQAIVVDADRADDLYALLPNVEKLEHVIPLQGGAYEEAIQAGDDIDPFLGRGYPQPSDPAVILSTSGTTGLPKGVVFLNTYSGAGIIAAHKWGIREPVKAYFSASWGHGQVQFITTWVFWSRGTLVLAPRFTASGFWDDVRRHGCDLVYPIGTMQQMIFNQPERDDDSQHPVKYFISTGMPIGTWDAFESRFGVRIFELYSGTDAGGSFMSNPGIYPSGSVGRPFIESEARIVDDAGNDVASGDVGVLMMRQIGVPASVNYYGDPEESKDKIRDEWVWMGDLFRQDADGNYYFIDRARDLIRRRGINLAPASIEQPLATSPDIDEVSAFAVPSDLGEDEIKVVIVGRDGSLTEKQVAEFAGERLPRHMRPRYIELVDEMPKTLGTAKIQRYQLRQNWRTASTWDVESEAYLTSDREG